MWNLFVYDEQIMHAADCKELAEKAEGLFRQAKKPLTYCQRFLSYLGEFVILEFQLVAHIHAEG